MIRDADASLRDHERMSSSIPRSARLRSSGDALTAREVRAARPARQPHPAEPDGWKPLAWGLPVGWDVPVYSADLRGWPAVEPRERVRVLNLWPRVPSGLFTAAELAEEGLRPRNALRPDALQVGPAHLDGEPISVDWQLLGEWSSESWQIIARQLGRNIKADNGILDVRYPVQALYRRNRARPRAAAPTTVELREDRQQASTWAKTALADSSTIILETSAVGTLGEPINNVHNRAAMVEIAICTTDGHQLLSEVINPAWGDALSERLAGTGLAEERVRAAPTFKQLQDRLLQTLAGRRVICVDRAQNYGLLYCDMEYYEWGDCFSDGDLPGFGNLMQMLAPLRRTKFECLRIARSYFEGKWDDQQRPVLAKRLSRRRRALDRVHAAIESLREMAAPLDRYQQLCAETEQAEASGRSQQRQLSTIERRTRLSQTRAAVLLRSNGLCENPDCMDTGYRLDVTDEGEPLLEVHHTDGDPTNALASGGRDHPSVAVALCPNCHDRVTRGRHGGALNERLAAVASDAHQRYLLESL